MHKLRRDRIATELLAVVLLLSLSGSGQTTDQSWVISLESTGSSISSHTSREDLVRRFGAAHVIDRDIDIGEGETEAGTIVFPDEANREIEILWRDKNAKVSVKRAQIQGKASLWKAPRGISLGTCMKDLEGLNQKPFELFGFSWDYSGTVSSWEDGALDKDLSRKGRVIVRLEYSPEHPGVTDDEVNQVQGDAVFSSRHPVMQKLNPCAYQIIWSFE